MADAVGAGDDMTLTAEQREIKDEFVRVRGTWGEPWQRMLDELDPPFLRAYLNFSSVPWVRASHLEPKIKEFVSIAADAAATHLYEPGIRQHIRLRVGLRLVSKTCESSPLPPGAG